MIMARTLTRDLRRGLVGGVASGFGRYLDVDPVIVRLAFVALTFANGLGVLLYVVAWALVPRGETAADPLSPGVESALAGAQDVGRRIANEGRGVRLGIGYGLIGLGTLLLLHNLDWIRWPHWARFEVLWPVILVGMGGGLVLRSLRKEPTT
jgi:phage shock protein C